MKNRITTEFHTYGVKPDKPKRPDLAGRFASAKHPESATPPGADRFKGSYSTGDGDEFHQLPRPGSDHSHIKSRGDGC